MAIEKVKEYFAQFGIADRVQEFDVSSATVELAAQALNCEPCRIAKTLSFMVDGHAILIVAAGDANIDKVLEIADKIMGICQEPLCFEAILQKLFADYGLTMNFEQYVLVGSTVRSYLAWLKDAGRLNGLFENNMLLWQRV